jgi:Flp pilus assembly protein TadD
MRLRRDRRVLLGALAALLLFMGAALVRSRLRADAIAWLDRGGPAHWILYPLEPRTSARAAMDLDATFRRRFDLASVPAEATLQVRAFRGASVALNGAAVWSSDGVGWKRSAEVRITGLREGENVLEAVVTNRGAPPALELALVGEREGTIVQSDSTWEVELAGAPWRPARRADEPSAPDPGLLPGESAATRDALASARGPLLLLACAAAVAMGGMALALRAKALGRQRVRAAFLMGACGSLWIALYANNAPRIPLDVGFDAMDHLEYIDKVQSTGALPRAGEGWQTYQPPLFYAASALALKLTGASTAAPRARWVLRALTFAGGLALVALVLAAASRIFPLRSDAQALALLFAAFLPMHLVLFHYIGNEAFAAPLVTLSSLIFLKTLSRGPSARDHVWLGAALGLALLAKFSALLALPPILAVLLGRGVLEGRGREALRNAALVLGVCGLVSGWHFARVAMSYGHPLVGNWDERLGFAWWQDPGLRTPGDYLRGAQAFAHPWLAGFQGVNEGLIATLFGDSLSGGAPTVAEGPPWNRELVAAGYGLALLPALLLLIGFLRAVIDLVRRPSAVWVFLLGCLATGIAGLYYMTLKVPAYTVVKLFYAQVLILPLCALFALGGEQVLALARWRAARALLWVGLGTWAANAYASVWIAPQRLAARAFEAQSLLRANQPEKALEAFEDVLRECPDLAAARGGRLVAWLQMERIEDAAAECSALGTQRSCSSLAWIACSQLHSAQGALALAEAELRRAIECDPSQTEAHLLLAGMLEGTDRPDAAVAVLEGLLAFDPSIPDVHRQLARLHLARGDPARAIRHAGLCLRLDPHDREALELTARAEAASSLHD